MSSRRLTPSEIRQLLVDAENQFRHGQLAEAEACCRAVLATAPNNPLATHYLGAIAMRMGRVDDALKLLGRAIELDPNVAAYAATYAQVLAQVGRFEEALVAIRDAARLDPNKPRFQYQLGALAGQLGHVDESIVALERAVQMLPAFPGPLNDLAMSLMAARRVPEALDCLSKAIQIDATYRTAFDNLIYFSHFASGIDGAEIRALAESFAARFAEPLKCSIVPHTNDRTSDRRLRVGFVSPDLWIHPVGRFLLPILRFYDRDAFEIFCYSDTIKSDIVTNTLRQQSQGWRDSRELTDEQLAAAVREDRIDILIDLSLHMGRNRLLVFAQKPAPVQVTYLGYPGTTGMSAMDWRISDEQLDPPGNDRFYTERTYRLPRGYWSYVEPVLAESPTDILPRDPAAPIRFIALNNTIKFSDAALEAWARIVSSVADSTILLQAEPGAHRDAMMQFFARAGVDPQRISFAEKKDLLGYFHLYESADIALDSFPYAGGTTTCDALWMGVPVITLAGQIAVQRGGVSILTNVGLTQFVTESIDDYVTAAVALANNPQQLAQLRSSLRTLMKSSSLMRPQEFVADLQSAWRAMWRNWAKST